MSHHIGYGVKLVLYSVRHSMHSRLVRINTHMPLI